jgi:cytoskeleton protein RodZ
MSSAVERDGSAAVAPRAGEDLRVARERVGWSLPEMAAGLRIRRQYLEALEAGRLDELPGTVYALGFLRTYSASLGLDPNEITRRFKTEAGAVNAKTELAFPAPVPERGVPAGAVVLLGVVLAVVAYAGWYRLSGEGRLPAETSTQIPMHLAPLAEQAVPPSTPPFSIPTPTAPAPTLLVAATPAPATTTLASLPPSMAVPPPASAPSDAAPAPQVEAPPTSIFSPGSAVAAPVPPLPIPPVPNEAADQSRILLRANSDAWIQVRDRVGQVLFNRILHGGETWAVPGRSNLLLTTGNAGGTDLLVDGVVSPSLGGYGVVRRDVPLEPDLIREGRVGPTQPVAAMTQPVMPRANPQ